MKPISSKIWDAIIDISPIQFGIYDLEEHTQIYSSGIAEKLLGYDFGELQNFSHDFYRQLIAEEDFPSFKDNIQRLIDSKSDIQVEGIYRVKNKAGDIIWVRSHHRVLERDSDGRPIKLIASSEDITELKRLENQLEQEVSKLRAIPSENVEELRVQLNAVTNIMSQFRENHFTSEMDQRLWNYMYNSVRKMDNVLNDLLR
jgi:PAS domain S-box-containing protein